jgi:hypothetical protein
MQDHLFCNHLYPSQTKILEGRTNLSGCVFVDSSKHFSTFCSPKRVLTPLKSASPGNALGNVCSTDEIYPSQTLKRASKTHSERFVRPFRIQSFGERKTRRLGSGTANKKIARFRTRDLTKVTSYVSSPRNHRIQIYRICT